MAYQPTHPSPYMEVVDATKPITFRCLANSRDDIVDARINIYTEKASAPISVLSGLIHKLFYEDSKYYIEVNTPDKALIDSLVDIGEKIEADTNNNYEYFIFSGDAYGKITKITKKSGTTSYGNTIIYIFTDSENFNLRQEGDQWNIYYEQKTIPFPDNYFKTLSASSEKWLSCVAEANTFISNAEYAWDIDIYTSNEEVLCGVQVGEVEDSDWSTIGDDGQYYTASGIRIRTVYSKDLLAVLKEFANEGGSIINDHCFLLVGEVYGKISSFDDNSINKGEILLYILNDDLKLLSDNQSAKDPKESIKSMQNTLGIIYSTKPIVTTSPRYFFQTKPAPKVTFNVGGEIKTSTHTFKATYEQKRIREQGTKISYYEFNLYSLGELIASSGHKYSQVIEHTFDNLANNNSYSIELTIVNDDGMEITESRTFDVVYAKYTELQTTAIADNYQTFVSVDFSKCISNSSEHNGYLIQRYDIKNNKLHCIARLEATDKYFEDYNLRSDNEYEYQILPLPISENGTETYSSIIKSNKVYTDWDTWSIIGMKPTDDEKAYTVDYDNVWIFNANVESDAISPIYNKTYLTGMGRFPKEIQGDENYLEGKVSCLLGNVSCNGNYVGDNIDTIKKWQAFCRNGDMKLLKNPKGYVIPCSIKDTTSSVNYNVLEEITTISFSFVQLMDSSDISVYGLGGVDRWLGS